MTEKICNEMGLDRAKKLVECMEQGDDVHTIELIEELSSMRESDLFMELGKLTRDLHDTLRGFQLDSKIFDMTEKDIPDAKERLNHVITMTEEAADKTLTLVESSLPIADDLKDKSTELQEKWNRFKSRDMDVNEFRSLSNDLDEFFALLNDKTPALQSNLSDILMAQGFQDLTGQIIRRVITMVQEVEDSLVDLVRITGEKMAQPQQQQKQAQEEPKGPDIEAVGPAVPGVDKGDIVSGQDDVDDLLSSLGF